MQTKKCGKCKEVKDVDMFCKDKWRKDGRKCQCKACVSAAQKVIRATAEGQAYQKASKAKKDEENPMWQKHGFANSKAKSLGLPGRITEQQVKDLFAGHGHFCYYCDVQSTDPSVLTLDHYMPFERGGKNAIQNCVPACAKCNFIKNDMDPEEFIEKKAKKPLTS
tara:strand:+ start:698 stop:1192 length:495 start_codon:yes stop_codon:yes gene_type:complete